MAKNKNILWVLHKISEWYLAILALDIGTLGFGILSGNYWNILTALGMPMSGEAILFILGGIAGLYYILYKIFWCRK